MQVCLFAVIVELRDNVSACECVCAGSVSVFVWEGGCVYRKELALRVLYQLVCED